MYGVTFLFSNCKTMWTSTPNRITFRGDAASLNINRFYWNFAGFAFAFNITLWRSVAVTFQKKIGKYLPVCCVPPPLLNQDEEEPVRAGGPQPAADHAGPAGPQQLRGPAAQLAGRAAAAHARRAPAARPAVSPAAGGDDHSKVLRPAGDQMTRSASVGS